MTPLKSRFKLFVRPIAGFSTEDERDYKNRLLKKFSLIQLSGEVGSLIIFGYLWQATGQMLLVPGLAVNLLIMPFAWAGYKLAASNRPRPGSWLLIAGSSIGISVYSWLLGTEVIFPLAFIAVIGLAVALMETWEVLLVTGLGMAYSVTLYATQDLFKTYIPPVTLASETQALLNVALIFLVIPLTIALLLIPSRSLLGLMQLRNKSLYVALAEQKQAEEAAREREEQFRAIFEQAAIGISQIDLEGRFLQVNPKLCSILGYTQNELLELNIRDVSHPDDLDSDLTNFQQLWRSQISTYSMEKRNIRKDGSVVWINLTVSLIKTTEGSPKHVISLVEDITTRKQTELMLKKSEANLRAIFDSANQSIMLFDRDFRFLAFNRYAEKSIWQVNAKAVKVGDSFLDYLREDDRDEVMSRFQRVLTGEIIVLERQIKGTDGTSTWTEFYYNPIRLEDGEITGVSLTGRTITERKEAERVLRESEARYRAIVEDQTEVVVRANRDWKCTFVNEAYCRYFGVKREELIGQSFFFLLPEQSRIEVMQHFINPEIFNPDHQTTVYEHQVIAADGEKRWMQWTDRIIFDEQGRFLEFQLVGRDITEQKKAEEALRASENLLSFIYNGVSDLMFVISIEPNERYRCISANKVFLEYTGFKEEQMVGKLVTDFLPPNMAQYSIGRYNEAVKSGKTIRYEEGFKLPGGWTLIETALTPIYDNTGRCTHVLGISRDITQKKALEQEQQKAQKLESLGILAGGIAHDFNNILTGVMGNISLAKMEAADNLSLHELLNEAETAVLRARGLTQQLLTFSKGGTPVKKAADLKTLLAESAKFALRGSNVSCRLEIDENLWPVEVDEGQINQVINNLVINADQAMPGGGTVTVSAENVPRDRLDTVLPLKPANYVRVKVRDEGLGIPEKNLSKIFDPYFTTKQKGSGLGLATSFSIITRHDGLITVESEMNRGTIFTIYLPASNKVVGPEAETPSPKQMARGGRVLVLDDETTIRDLIKRLLTHFGYEVDGAKDGAEAVELYKTALAQGRIYDVVVMDLTIPGGMGGKEALERLREIDPEVRALVTSGYSNDPVVAQYQKYGFLGAISKPFKLQELREKIDQITRMPVSP